MDIMNHVDILDLIRIDVYRANVLNQREYSIDLVSLDQNKRVVVDESAMKTLESLLLDKSQQFKDGADPKVSEYLKEFTGRMCSEWHRNGLLMLENIPEAASTPYDQIDKVLNKR